MKRKLYITAMLSFLALLLPFLAAAQSGTADVPLGDVARALRKKKAQPVHTVIDNDNLPQVMDEVQKRKLSDVSPLLSIEPGKNFQVSSPDVTCSLSFSAQAVPLLNDSIVSKELPDSELLKLDGPAAITGDTLQLSVYNGTGWNVREITVGLTVVRHENAKAAYYGSVALGSAKLIPAAATDDSAAEKRSDLTLLYHLKGKAAPLTTTVFREPLGITLRPDQEWHWAIVHATGIPPR